MSWGERTCENFGKCTYGEAADYSSCNKFYCPFYQPNKETIEKFDEQKKKELRESLFKGVYK